MALLGSILEKEFVSSGAALGNRTRRRLSPPAGQFGTLYLCRRSLGASVRGHHRSRHGSSASTVRRCSSSCGRSVRR